MELCVYEKSNDVRDILNNGFYWKGEQERLLEKHGTKIMCRKNKDYHGDFPMHCKENVTFWIK